MTAHKIFDGAFVMYSDMHLKNAVSHFRVVQAVRFSISTIAGRDESKTKLAIMLMAIYRSMKCELITGVSIRDEFAFRFAITTG